MSGTVNISRDLWDDTAFADEKFSEREAWVWLIAEASWKPRTRRIGKAVVETKRGEVAGSVRFFAERFGWSKSRFDRFLGRLVQRDMVSVNSGTGVNVITISKYDEYQSKPKDSGTPAGHLRDSSGTPAGQQRDKREEGGNKEEIRIDDDGAHEGATSGDLTFRERILIAIGVDPVSGLTGRGGQMIGKPSDMQDANRWLTDLLLTEAEAIAVIAETMLVKTDGPPSSFRYFDGPMAKAAGRKNSPRLVAVAPSARDGPRDDYQPRRRIHADPNAI